MEDYKKELRNFGNIFFSQFANEAEATQKLKMLNGFISENKDILPFITSEETAKQAGTVIKIAQNPKMSMLKKAAEIGKLFTSK